MTKKQRDAPAANPPPVVDERLVGYVPEGAVVKATEGERHNGWTDQSLTEFLRGDLSGIEFVREVALRADDRVARCRQALADVDDDDLAGQRAAEIELAEAVADAKAARRNLDAAERAAAA